MFRGLFKGHNTNDEEDEYFDPVDPIVEQRRKEKFSTPLIYDDFTETKRQTTITKPAIAKETIEVPMQTKKSGYEPMEVISPMRGVSRSKEAAKKECVVKDRQKPKRRKQTDQLIPVISPFFGSYGHKEETYEEDVIKQPVDTPKEENISEKKQETYVEKADLPKESLTTEEKRNIQKILEEEKSQLKIIEERTGEFKLDLKNEKKDTDLIDEIDDNMSLDELMKLYEKKFID